MRNILMVLGLVLATAGCGSGFVKGWVDRDQTPEGSDEEQCSRRKGHTWVNGTCALTSDLNLADIASEDQCKQLPDHSWFDDKCLPNIALTEAQCGQVLAWAWFENQCRPSLAVDCMEDPAKVFVDGECLVRPTIATEGAVQQTTVVGAPIQPVKLTLSAGAFAELRNQTCADFFKLEANRIVSKDGFEQDGAPATCAADLVAVLGAAESRPVRFTASIEPGFFSACQGKHPSAEAIRTARVLVKALEKTDCEQATKALKEITKIQIPNAGLKDISALRGLTKLEWLDLAGNDVEDVAALADLPALAMIDLTNNKVKSVAPLAKLPKLNFLYVDGNPLFNGGAARTPENCPTGEGVNAEVVKACSKP